MKSLLRLQEYREGSPGLKSLGQACERLRIPSLGNESGGGSSTSGGRGGGGDAELPLPKQQHRVVVMGAARVGKSTIISQFLYDKYLPRYRETIEELHRGEYELPDGASLTLDILDTSGAYQFPAMRALSISTAGAFLLVYAVDQPSSWDELCTLREQIVESRGWRVPIVVVGNKTDVEERAVSREIAESISTIDWQCGYAECSAKDNSGILEVFKELLVQAKVRYNLSPAVRRRRQSLPNYVGGGGNGGGAGGVKQKSMLKRHSCTVA